MAKKLIVQQKKMHTYEDEYGDTVTEIVDVMPQTTYKAIKDIPSWIQPERPLIYWQDIINRPSTVNGTAIADSLTSNATDTALSANQGRVLKKLIDGLLDKTDTTTTLTNQNVDIIGEGGAVNIIARDSQSVNITSTDDCVNISANVDVNLSGSAIHLTSENVELNNDYTPSYKNSVVNKGYVDSLKSELIGLRETLYGVTSLETTSVRIEDGGVIPSMVNVGGTDYNVIPKGDVSVLSVEGDSVKGENLFQATGTLIITRGDEHWGYYNANEHFNGLVVGQTYTIKSFNVPSGIEAQFLPSYRDFTNSSITFTYQGGEHFRIGANHTDTDISYKLEIMIVKGNQAPTEFQPYFEGLKPTEYKSLNIYSPNVLKMTDVSSENNGITYTIKNGVITLNGTATSNTALLRVITDNIVNNSGLTLANFGNLPRGLILNVSAGDDAAYMQIAEGTTVDTAPTDNAKISSFYIYVYQGHTFNNATIKPMLIKGNVAPTTFVPYYSTPILSVPTTLQGVEGYRDTLEVRLNEDTLYDVYKVTKCKSVGFNSYNNKSGTENGRTTYRFMNDLVSQPVFVSNLNYEARGKWDWWNSSANLDDTKGYLSVDQSANYCLVVIPPVGVTPDDLVVTYPLATPTETRIKSNLTFDQVTALVHTLSNVKIVNPNDIYLNKPKVNLGLVYKKVIS